MLVGKRFRSTADSPDSGSIYPKLTDETEHITNSEGPKRKRRTREHAIEDLSENHLEQKVLLRGHLLRRPVRDYWALEIHPFILVVFDVRANKAHWLHIQEYIDQNPERVDPDKETVNVHIPTSNELSLKSIDHFRKMSLLVRKSHSWNQHCEQRACQRPKVVGSVQLSKD